MVVIIPDQGKRSAGKEVNRDICIVTIKMWVL